MEDFEILELENKGGKIQATCCLEDNPFYFRLIGPNKFAVVGYASEMKNEREYRIPSKVKYQGKDGDVVEIADYAFENCYSLYILVVPESIKKISRSAFYQCEGIREIWIENEDCVYETMSFPKGVKVYGSEECKKKAKNIKKWCYYQTAKVEIPNDVTWLGLNAFEGYCNISQIEIPDSVEIIGRCAFAGCTSLEKIVIPKNVRIVEERAFVGCSKLKEIWYLNEDCRFDVDDPSIPEQTAIYTGVDKRRVR